MKVTLTLQLDLEPQQLSSELAERLTGLVAAVNGHTEPPPEPETTPQPPPLPDPTKKRRGRPPKGPALPAAEFDALVRAEMKRLAEYGRMPDHRRWNNERDVQLPTMAGVLAAYEVQNILQLAHKLELRPPLSALGVSPYPQADEGTGQEVEHA